MGIFLFEGEGLELEEREWMVGILVFVMVKED